MRIWEWRTDDDKSTAVISRRAEGASPESTLPMVVMDSGFARFASAPE